VSCPVEDNCRDTTMCPFCVNYSEYQPVDRRVLSPALVALREGRRVARAEHRASAPFQRGKAAARKGGHLEKELARLVGGYVVPMSGALDGKPNDVVARNGWRLECKGRADGFGLIYRWLEAADVVAMREPDGKEMWLFACRLSWMVLRLEDRQPVGDPATVLAAVEAAGALPAQVWGGVVVSVRRPAGLTQVRRWLDAEAADVLCPHRNLAGFAAVMDAEHLAALLAANEGD